MKKIEYSHENYRNLIEESEIYNGKSNCYFCIECKRYVPKKDSNETCPFCGSNEWKLDSPLLNEIIDTEKLKEYMSDTYTACIEPFTNFETQHWKNGKFLHRVSNEIIKIDKRHYNFKDMELWCVSHHGLEGWYLSFCMKWNEIFNYREDETVYIDTKVKFVTVKAQHEETVDIFDDVFYFNLMWNTILKEGYNINQLWHKRFDCDEENKEKICIWVHSCCEPMIKYSNKFHGCLYHEQLNNGDFTKLMKVLDDFTLLPRYWGYKQ